jgi:uncharacterized damage-inducible protein DinB
MKAYFTRLFNYDLYANMLLIDKLMASNTEGKAAELMAHLLVSQQIWLGRCQLDPIARDAQWPNWSVSSLKAIAEQNHADWIGFLEGISASDFSGIITYQNSKGQVFNNTLSDILAHLINHGTHHRAQAGQYLKQAGIQLPVTDYIFYIRQL